ncbi:RING finger protein B [Linum perenne]
MLSIYLHIFRIQGTPAGARNIPLPVIFCPLFLLQGAGVLLAASKLAEKLILLLRSESGAGRYFRFSSRFHDSLGFLRHGSRLMGWWSIDEGSREEQARLYREGAAGLQAALGEQTEVTRYSQQEFERLQNEKVLCRVCFEGEINVVLLPCRHRILCSTCCEKCKKCPICRVPIEERLPVYDV